MLTAFGVSHPGRVRKNNEDSLFFDVDLGLFVVADGMGGHNSGEVASRIAVDVIGRFLTQARAVDDFTWPFGLNPAMTYDANCLATSLRIANREVLQESHSDDRFQGMGTTVVAAVVDDAGATFCSVGDSRIYAFTGGRLEQLTRDDSWIADMLESGEAIDERALAAHPMRHVLTNVIGAQDDLHFKVFDRALGEGDLLLFCTDGLHGVVAEGLIAEVLRTERSLEAAANCLVECALKEGGRDNVTVLLVREGGGRHAPW